MSWFIGAFLFVVSMILHISGKSVISAETFLIAGGIFTLAGSISWVATQISKKNDSSCNCGSTDKKE